MGSLRMTVRSGATRNRFAAVAATTGPVLGLTAACGSSGGPHSGTIHVLVHGDVANKVEKQIVDAFNKTSKVKALLDTIPGAHYQSKLNTIINTPQAPVVPERNIFCAYVRQSCDQRVPPRSKRVPGR